MSWQVTDVCAQQHIVRQRLIWSPSHWLYGGSQLPAAGLALCCPPVHTQCPSAASPRSLRPGWLLPAACAGSAAHTHTHTHTENTHMLTTSNKMLSILKATHLSHHSLESQAHTQLFRLYRSACRSWSAHYFRFSTAPRFLKNIFYFTFVFCSSFPSNLAHFSTQTEPREDSQIDDAMLERAQLSNIFMWLQKRASSYGHNNIILWLFLMDIVIAIWFKMWTISLASLVFIFTEKTVTTRITLSRVHTSAEPQQSLWMKSYLYSLCSASQALIKNVSVSVSKEHVF